MSNETPEAPPNTIVAGIAVAGMMSDPLQPAPSAREADSILVHWHVVNLTDAEFTLTFPTGNLFRLTLHDTAGTQIWHNTPPDPGPDTIVLLGVGERYSIPEEDENGMPRPDLPESLVPRINLKQVLADNNIPIGTDLYINFTPLSTTYLQSFRIDLWR